MTNSVYGAHHENIVNEFLPFDEGVEVGSVNHETLLYQINDDLTNLHSERYPVDRVVNYFNNLNTQFRREYLIDVLKEGFFGETLCFFREPIFFAVWGTDCHWLADCLVKYALSSFCLDPNNTDTKYFFQTVMGFLCDKVIQQNVNFEHSTSEDSLTRLLARFVLASNQPESAVTRIIKADEKDFCSESILQDLCQCLFIETAASMEYPKNDRERYVDKLIAVLQWMLLRSSNKAGLIQSITESVAFYDDFFWSFRENFANLMTRSEENQFFHDLNQQEKKLKLGSQSGARLAYEVNCQEQDFSDDSTSISDDTDS